MLQAPADPSRVFVVEKPGRVKVFDNDPQVAAMTDFVDITGRVFGGQEAGLLGMTFHPDWANNREVFLSYTRAGSPLESVISRFRSLDGGVTLDPSTEEVVLTVLQDFENHNGGHVAFGTDGYLYIGFGDGGNASDPNNRAQDDATLLGKLVRIEVDGAVPYAIPADNPHAANGLCLQGFGGGPCPEIFAKGFRNPWRFSIDRATGEVWAGDVGQGRLEEIDRVILGSNYGWRIREANTCHLPASNCQTAGLIDPVHSYGRNVGISVTGGFVYRGALLGPLVGRYIFGDFGSGRIFALPANPGTGVASQELLDTSFSIASFAEDLAGELYVLDFSGGQVHQLIPGP
jgi:glucose/arabinose dehydrogenase